MSAKKEFGDFQTPQSLAEKCIRRGMKVIAQQPTLVLEPTCGVGAFVSAAALHFPSTTRIVGVDINADYVASAVLSAARSNPRANVEVYAQDFFSHDWRTELSHNGNILVVGNPPWVTSSMLGALQSGNLPKKSNFQGLRGLDALTGKANFDISEWMLLQYVDWLKERKGAFLVLCKTSVARKVARSIWKAGVVPRQAIFLIDAKRDFDVSVDACLYVVDFSVKEEIVGCDVYDTLDTADPSSSFGIVSGALASNIAAANELRWASGSNDEKWRSGVKHDCSPVLELTRSDAGYSSKVSDNLALEDDVVFPLAKCSDVAAGKHRGRYVLLPQRHLSDDTAELERSAPQAWSYLTSFREHFDRRASRIYRGKSDFSVFGIGPYTFKPWKVAIAALYKRLDFALFGPLDGKPVIFDDTVYFLGFDTREEAECIQASLMTQPAQQFLAAHIFWSDKRPITTELLNRLSLSALRRVDAAKRSAA